MLTHIVGSQSIAGSKTRLGKMRSLNRVGIRGPKESEYWYWVLGKMGIFGFFAFHMKKKLDNVRAVIDIPAIIRVPLIRVNKSCFFSPELCYMVCSFHFLNFACKDLSFSTSILKVAHTIKVIYLE